MIKNKYIDMFLVFQPHYQLGINVNYDIAKVLF